jgi:uncharacterized membrane protein YgcG
MVKHAALGLLVVLSVLSGASAAFADDFGARVSGQHVYDRANILSPEQLQVLERRAANLGAVGAPTVVYVRVEAASQSQVQQEARELMDAWDVESAPNAHDGFVMLFDLTPGDTRQGQVGMFAGAEHASAELDHDEINRIASQVMRPSLASGDLAGGISAGLEATAEDLGQPASGLGSPGNYPISSPSSLLSASLAGLFGLLALPFVVPLAIFIMVFVMISRAISGASRGRSWSSRSASTGWTDNSSWSGGGGDSSGASSGGDSGGSSF